MRSCLRLLVVALVAVTPLVAQEPTPGPGTSPPADRPTVPAPSATRPSSTDLGDFAGLWDTSYGRLRLV
ncbi:MAG TPA: hypothetical protein PKC45_13585, partial [Gemmatales bacterium]|nr:hypothetical protein [Gemmatales bacterium]